MLEKTQQRVYLSLNAELLMRFEAELLELLKRRIKVVIITDQKLELPGAIIYYSDRIDDKIRVIVDSVEVLSGHPEKNCLYSRNENLFTIFKDMLTNEIELLKLKGGA
jgi:sugar-specific transcriptional regulator TrmB